MPQEFLRDVLRTGDAAARRQRHWSVLPLSIAGHAAVVTVCRVQPVGDRRGPFPLLPRRCRQPYIETVPPSAPPEPSPPTLAPPKDTSAPIKAPDGHRRREPAPPPTGSRSRVARPNGPGVEAGPPLLVGLSTPGPLPAPPAPPVEPKPVRVGGVIREPRKLVHVAPLYPDIARHLARRGHRR